MKITFQFYEESRGFTRISPYLAINFIHRNELSDTGGRSHTFNIFIELFLKSFEYSEFNI